MELIKRQSTVGPKTTLLTLSRVGRSPVDRDIDVARRDGDPQEDEREQDCQDADDGEGVLPGVDGERAGAIVLWLRHRGLRRNKQSEGSGATKARGVCRRKQVIILQCYAGERAPSSRPLNRQACHGPTFRGLAPSCSPLLDQYCSGSSSREMNFFFSPGAPAVG
jgi:hypothetical protein